MFTIIKKDANKAGTVFAVRKLLNHTFGVYKLAKTNGNPNRGNNKTWQCVRRNLSEDSATNFYMRKLEGEEQS